MSVKSEPCYWVECDSCHDRCDYGEFSAMSDRGSALDGAALAGWSNGKNETGGDVDHCPDCEPFCDHCRKPAGPDWGERDFLCRSCFGKAAREHGREALLQSSIDSISSAVTDA